MSFQKRLVSHLMLVVTFVFSLACQSVSKILPASNETPEFSTNSMGYDGNWKGTTSQGFEITFTVVNDKVAATKFQTALQNSNCISAPLTTGYFNPGRPIKNHAFTIVESISFLDDISYAFTGTFSSTDTASGTVEYINIGGSCPGTEIFDWTATKTTR